jgi:septal ring factor EnvC (AmiA/AmiB activator)
MWNWKKNAPETVVMPAVSAPAPSEPGGRRKQWLRWGIPALTFVIGLALGGTSNQADVESSPTYVALQSELSESQDEVDQLADQVAEAKKQIRQATADGEAQLAAKATELDQRTALLDQREQALVAREAASAPTAAPVPQPATRVAPAAPTQAAPAPQAQTSTSTYFKNCDAVRAAGAAPVRLGDPGYAGHLDRDGDGVGCE